MARAGVAQLQQRLDGLLAYLQPYWDFLNCHMVNYLTDKHWISFVPEELRQELECEEDIQMAIEELFWTREQRESERFPNWSKHLRRGEQEHLKYFKDLITTLEELSGGNENKQQLSIKEFMSAKKCHEVELTASLVDRLIQRTGEAENIYIVDAGDGKGYLSSRLALQYGYRVLGIDANPANTENALERNRKLQRAWNGLTERADLESRGISPKCRDKQSSPKDVPSLQNYRTTARFITTDLNLNQILAEQFTEFSISPSSPICLTGLHTCGNLAATCLQVFHSQSQCQILCNIGCCYHLLKETFSQQEFFGNKSVMDLQTDCGFPLSRYLQNRQFRMGRNARMLAAQSIERTLNAKDLPNISLYYRACLEVLVCRHAPNLKNELQVGKVRNFKDFPDYIQKCGKKLEAKWLDDVHPDELQALVQDYSLDKHYLELFYLLRMTFAPALESLILLDRLLYLKELGYDRSYIVDLFDAVISPRHYAIIAFKS
ncbi:probable methyltransferase-like protein 25 [Drosophila tropicalis]|uniref:probable methyltransferase-like protein 25 n=1 Tax=Drosophila tropicalis TaxID=46794 RepID=UPI0035ABD7C0